MGKLTLEIIKTNVERRVAEINLREDRDISFLGILGNELKGNQTKLILRCNIHNVTWTTTSYNNFMKPGFTGGCKMCKSESITKASKFTPEEAQQKVENFQKGSRFNYDFSSIKDTYKEFHQKVTVVCPKHGPFEVIYCNLLLHKNSGMCPECRKEELSERRTIRNEDIIQLVTDRINQIKSDLGVELEFLGIKESEGRVGLRRYLILRCKTHDITWDTTNISNFIRGTTIIGCPICNAQFLHEVKV